MSHYNAEQIIFRQTIVQQQTEPKEHPGQVGSREHEQSQKAESDAGVAARPDVDQTEAQRGAEEGHGGERREQQERGGAVE